MPGRPHAFYGSVTIGEVSATEGTVSAWVGENEYASTTISAGEYGKNPTLKVPGDDPSTPEKEGAVGGDVIVFKVNGVPAETAPAGPILFESGEVDQVDLVISGVTYTLTMAVNGSGSTSPAVGAHPYPTETVVTIIANPDSGWEFDSWSGDLTGSTNPTTITMDSDKSVTATFTQISALAVTTVPATYSTTTATLNGYLTLGDASSANVSFEWGTSTSYGKETSTKEMTSTGSFGATLSGLSDGTTYRFRAKAEIVGETPIYGWNKSFTTRAKPTTGEGPSGGGGGASYYYADMNLFGIEGRFLLRDGEIVRTIEATSENGMLTIAIPKGAVAKGEDGKRLKELEVAVDKSPPDPPEDAHVIGLAYNFGPAGATFDPPVTLT
ncbi:unnamed protein product, partial [marine sediment metagenome]